uniref:Uncharacterized protein n=1 Tax=Cucumis melo TaxID=3656 RepID=A0A9I9EGF4_CUCME
MSYRRSTFMETDDMFLQFEDDLDNNIAEGHHLWATIRSLLLNKRLRLLGDVRSLDSWS